MSKTRGPSTGEGSRLHPTLRRRTPEGKPREVDGATDLHSPSYTMTVLPGGSKRVTGPGTQSRYLNIEPS